METLYHRGLIHDRLYWQPYYVEQANNSIILIGLLFQKCFTIFKNMTLFSQRVKAKNKKEGSKKIFRFNVRERRRIL